MKLTTKVVAKREDVSRDRGCRYGVGMITVFETRLELGSFYSSLHRLATYSLSRAIGH